MKANAKDLRNERLDAIAENLACRPEVEADAERLLKETCAREIRKITITDNADNVKMFKNDGFTVDKLMKDMRYRVGAALSDAGLNNTTYASAVVSQMPTYVGAQH